jgi:tetratricopeptide (TPR) repeat protein
LKVYARALESKEMHTLKGKVVTYVNISGLLGIMGRNEDCIKYAEKAISIAPTYPKSYFNLASCQARLGRWQAALKNINIVLRNSPSPKHLMLKGFILMKQQRFERTIPIYAKVLRRNPNHQKALVNIGIAMSRVGKHDRALWFLKRAYVASPRNSSVLLSLIDINLMAGRRAKAAAYASMLLDLNGPSKVKSLLDQLSNDITAVPLSLERISPLIGKTMERRLEELMEYTRELQRP